LTQPARSGFLVDDTDEFALGLDQGGKCLLNGRTTGTDFTLGKINEFALGGDKALQGVLK
jgi:hypothetical protein